MSSLPQLRSGAPGDADAGCGTGGACGTSCGNGLEKIYPTTAIRYGAMRWIGEFTYRQGSVFTCGGKVVIQSDRGIELGEQVSLTCNGCDKSVSREQIKKYVEASGVEFFRPRSGRILRAATAQDIAENEKLNADIRADIDRCALLAAQMDLDLKVITCEHLLGGERIVFYFRSESRVDFRELVKELARHYRTRIEMRQVGPRDEARLVADYEICGRECCCKNFLKKMRPVGMRMAKVQKSTLDPTKVSGRCGRLRCCLRYEHEGYEELSRKLPQHNSFVQTSYGVGQVVDRQILTQLVLLRMTDAREITVPVEDISAFNVAEPENFAAGRFRRGADGESDGEDRGRGRRGPHRHRPEPPVVEAPPVVSDEPGVGDVDFAEPDAGAEQEPPGLRAEDSPPARASGEDARPLGEDGAGRGDGRRRRRRRRRHRGPGGAGGPPDATGPTPER